MNGRVEGYVKPLFRNLRIYGATQDEEKSFGQKFKRASGWGRWITLGRTRGRR
jgi:hypothetical protein